MAGSEDEETMVTRKKPVKVTRHLIELARTTKANQEAASKAVASIAPVLPSTGKRKLKREGVIYFGPSAQKKTKTDHPSGLTASDTYRRTHKDGKPADAWHESHIEVQAKNPWMVPNCFVDKLQELWDKVMLDWPYWFDEDDDVYRLCMQKIYEWHTHIGKAGTKAVEALWASHPKYENPEERKAYIDFALGRSLPFMYGSVEYLGANEYRVSKSFLLQLVLQTFASHIRDVSAVDNDTYHNLLDYAMPRGALVLAVTSVERALTLYSTGVKEVPTKRSEVSFSNIGWGTKTLLYTRSIMKVGDGKFDQIVSGAREYCSAAVRSRQVQVSYDVSAAGEINMDDDRVLIVVSSDIEAESDGEGKPFIAQMYTSLIACHYWTVPGGETA
ncbi:hypothetical protein HD554DRAFT_2247270 [Boletus coccyginus]|nr:hypothetical protein HD554DRAFT_2247270 [Boletus coccyginus]